jgi:hypothetical protein
MLAELYGCLAHEEQVSGAQPLTLFLMGIGYFYEVNFLPRKFLQPYTTGHNILLILTPFPTLIAK